MNKEVRVFILATLVGAATGATACAVFAHYTFAAHVLAASIVGGLIGALAGDSGRSLFEAAIICLIAGVLIALLVFGFRGGKTPNAAYELPVLLCASTLLGGATGRLGGSLTKV